MTQQQAEQARAFFELGERPDGSKYWKKTEAAPEWVAELCREAHRSWDDLMLPDDYRYQFIVDALDILSEFEDEDDITSALESSVDVYTADLTAWLASSADRLIYCDDAAQEYGAPRDTAHLLAMGQYAERREVLDAVRSFLEANDAEVES